MFKSKGKKNVIECFSCDTYTDWVEEVMVAQKELIHQR